MLDSCLYDVVNVGSTAVLKTLIKDTITGELVDPTTVLLEVEDAAGGITQYGYPTGADGDLIRLSLGAYLYNKPVSLPGRWEYRWSAEGDAVGTSPDGWFIVQPTIF